MIQSKKKYHVNEALQIYKKLLLPRHIEERMLNLLRQNKISKWFSGIGQEAIAVGTTLALSKEDYILPMHRNLGVFTTRGIDLYKLFCQLLGKADGFSRGRERSFHFGTLDHRIVGMISHLAATMPVADGLALASKLKGSNFVACSFCGDGGTSEGDFHEALNMAAVWKLPVIFIIENNGYGLSTPVNEQYSCEYLADRANGYGMEGVRIDGNNVFEVMETVNEARTKALKGKPTLIEAQTFRMRGHEEASGTFYVPDELFKEWGAKDPILRMEQWLKDKDMIQDDNQLTSVKSDVDTLFSNSLDRALQANDPDFNKEKEINSVLSPVKIHTSSSPSKNSSSEKRFIDAIQFALKSSLEEDDRYLLMGQDIADYGGVFKVTEGFADLFGKDRIRNTPIIESGVIGAAIGLSLEGFKPIIEMQFADFISCAFNQIINNLAKSHYRWTPPLNITIRAPHGAGVGAGPFHSQSPEGWFMQHPGLKIVIPSSVEDAQNLLYSSLLDPNPVLFFEHKKLYRSLRAITPDHCKPEVLGRAVISREGHDATIITYGMGVHWALERAEGYTKRGIELEIIDLRCINPIDIESIKRSVAKTNKVLLLQEASATLGPMSEISALITENCFEELDAPVMRCASLDTPVPFNGNLEKGYLAANHLDEQLDRLLSY